MTEKLYYKDAYIKEFEAKVISCKKNDKGFAVVLDKTAFYPEGGGQPCDLGIINEISVTDVREDGELIVHTIEAPIEENTVVSCSIDWERRFDLMQQHSGEHIVSGFIHRIYGYDNVGFHMGDEMITVDINGMLDMDALLDIEQKTNAYIWNNNDVKTFFAIGEELKALDYRSKKELSGDVRIVEYPNADMCACCGTHVAKTGEIGLVKIISVQKFHEGVRIEMLCGGRAMRYINDIAAQNRSISVILSAKVRETAAAVQRLADENGAVKFALADAQKSLFKQKAKEFEGKGNVVLFEKGLSPDAVRNLSNEIMECCGGRAAVFSGDDENGYKYAIGEKGGNLKEFVKQMNTALNGRGGGKPFFVQGSVFANAENINKYFETI